MLHRYRISCALTALVMGLVLPITTLYAYSHDQSFSASESNNSAAVITSELFHHTPTTTAADELVAMAAVAGIAGQGIQQLLRYMIIAFGSATVAQILSGHDYESLGGFTGQENLDKLFPSNTGSLSHNGDLLPALTNGGFHEDQSLDSGLVLPQEQPYVPQNVMAILGLNRLNQIQAQLLLKRREQLAERIVSDWDQLTDYLAQDLHSAITELSQHMASVDSEYDRLMQLKESGEITEEEFRQSSQNLLETHKYHTSTLELLKTQVEHLRAQRDTLMDGVKSTLEDSKVHRVQRQLKKLEGS